MILGDYWYVLDTVNIISKESFRDSHWSIYECTYMIPGFRRDIPDGRQMKRDSLGWTALEARWWAHWGNITVLWEILCFKMSMIKKKKKIGGLHCSFRFSPVSHSLSLSCSIFSLPACLPWICEGREHTLWWEVTPEEGIKVWPRNQGLLRVHTGDKGVYMESSLLTQQVSKFTVYQRQ